MLAELRLENYAVIDNVVIEFAPGLNLLTGETGAGIGGTLYGDSLSPAGGEADSYIKVLRHDVATLKTGMLSN